MWALSVCIFIPFYYPPLYFIIKICCICDLLHIQHFRELLKNHARMFSFDMPLLTRAQTEKECLWEKRAMSEMPECWGGVAWLELAGAGSQVQQPTPKMRHFIYHLGRDSVSVSAFFLFPYLSCLYPSLTTNISAAYSYASGGSNGRSTSVFTLER